MQSKYFACQVLVPGGYRLSKLTLIKSTELNSIRKLQYRTIDVTDDEFNSISTTWNKNCIIRSNWEMERWMELLNDYITKFRLKRKNIKPNKILTVITPTKPIEVIKAVEVIKPIEVIKPVDTNEIKKDTIPQNPNQNKVDIIIRPDSNGIQIEYETAIESHEMHTFTNQLLKESIEFINKRFNEMKAKLNYDVDLEIDLNLRTFSDIGNE